MILAKCGALSVDGLLYDNNHAPHFAQSFSGGMSGIDVIGNSSDERQVFG
jgi:hypothetical protein